MGFYTKKPLTRQPRMKFLVSMLLMVSLFGVFLFYGTIEARAEVLFTSTEETENIKIGDLQISFNRLPNFTGQIGIGATPTKVKLKFARFGFSSDPDCRYTFQAFRYDPLPPDGESATTNRDFVGNPVFSFNVIEKDMPPPGTFEELVIPFVGGFGIQFWPANKFIAIGFGNNSCSDRAPVLFKGTQNVVAQNFRPDGDFIARFACTLLEFNCATTKIAFTIEDDVLPPPEPVILSPLTNSTSTNGIIDVSGECLIGTGFDVISVRAFDVQNGLFLEDKTFGVCLEDGTFLTNPPLTLFTGEFRIRAFACDGFEDTDACTGPSNDVDIVVLFGGEDPIELIFVDQDFGLLGNALFDVLKFLFLPGENAFDPLQQIIGLIRSKPPLGFFDIVKDSISGIGVTGSAFALAGTSGLSIVLNPLKIGISFILWTLFTFWLFRRITSFEL